MNFWVFWFFGGPSLFYLSWTCLGIQLTPSSRIIIIIIIHEHKGREGGSLWMKRNFGSFSFLSFWTCLAIQLTPSSRSIIMIIIHEHKGEWGGGGAPHGWKENLGPFLFVFLNLFGNSTNSLFKKHHHHHHHHHPWTQTKGGSLWMKRTFGSFFLFVFLNLLGINQTLSLQWMNEENHYLFAMQFDDYPTPPPLPSPFCSI